MLKKIVASLELRKLLVKLWNEENYRLGIIQRLWENLRVLFIVFYENLRKLGYVKRRNHLAGQGKLQQGKTDGLVINQKRINLRQQPLSLKGLILTLVLKYQGTRLNEINRKNRVASTTPYISKINATVYKEILKKHVRYLRTAINQSAVFMQDNVLCHTAKSVETFLSDEDVTVRVWPAQSLDMNPIENIWKLLNERD